MCRTIIERRQRQKYQKSTKNLFCGLYMIRETGMQQQYCLRWNNHKTNLLMVFSELFRNEDFTDVTLACEGGSVIKCHKMVLAACSSYFQNLFSDLSCSHPVVVLKDIRYSEIQAILEYMYKGEVSITQEEVEPLLRVAEALKVKGLVGENEHRNKSEYNNSSISTSSSPYDASSRDREPSGGAHSSITRTTSMPNDLSNRDRDRDNANDNESDHNSPINENQLNASDDKNDRNDSSPPHSTSLHQSFHKNAHFYGKSPSNSDRLGNRIPPLPIWPMTGLPMTTFPTPHTTATAAAMLNSCHDAVLAASNSSMPPLRRKKLSSLLMNRDRDTPILRTVLGQGQADSSQPMSLVCHDGQEQEPQSNGPTMPQDLSYMNKSMKMETMSEDAHSPYMETSSFMDEDFSQDRGSKAMHSSSSSPQSFYLDSKVSVSSAIANYVPTQKPEWKRYKQYTRHDIMSAIEAVRNGMSALQAARKFGVPSRTLYDKVKKLGVTRITNRPFRRSNGSTGAAFPFGISGAGGSMLIGMPSEEENSPQSGMLEHGFLQHALEGGKLKMESSDHEAMSSTPISLQHGFMQRNLEIEERMKTMNVEECMKAEMNEREALSMVQGNTSGGSSSPTPNDRSPSPSPNHIKYAQHSNSLTPSPPLPPPIPPPDDDYEDQVEDLSMSRKPEQQSRVIMPPMNQATATTVLATCSGDGGRD